ncbi:MAG: 50S ribosomal protein L29 [Chitinophagales bacterium]|nr:50S ribosomal protein L29 [Chitinophagales bacterium]
MANKKINFKELSTQEVVEKLKEDRMHYKKMKFNHTVSQLENPIVLRRSRRDIARMITELKKRETAINK